MPPNYRRCLSCRKIAPKQEFWRVVRLFPTGVVQLDEGMGRSTYLCPSADCLQLAQKKNRMGRSLKATIPDSIFQSLQQRLDTQLDTQLKRGGQSLQTVWHQPDTNAPESQ